MRWIRTNRSWGGWLALAAMALQLVLSFGHVHLDGLHGGLANTAIAQAKTSASPSSPAQHPAGDADDFCPICAAIHLASTSFLPDPPQLPVPFVSQTIEHFGHVVAVATVRQRTVFRSRAPPLA